LQASAELLAEVRKRSAAGQSERAIAKALHIAKSSVGKYKKHYSGEVLTSAGIVPVDSVAPADQPTKRKGSFSWREACEQAKAMQKLRSKSSFSQDTAAIELGNGKDPVILATFADTHIGAYGANYELFEQLTEEILSTPNLYIALLGDTLEMAIRLRSVLEVTAQLFTPEMQESFLEDWLKEIRPKIAFGCWDNHAIIRQENQSGSSNVKYLLSRSVIYHNGIGHQDLKVGKQSYMCAASHKFRGNSMFNRMHAQGRYVRQEADDRELVFMGDIHTFGFTLTEDGGKERVYITGGTLHENSGYAKRFFSLKTSPHYPCVVLHPDEHTMVPFKTIGQALRYIGK
jgi:hypothetical protein